MTDGLGSPYFKCYCRGKELTHPFTRLRYVEAEESDDHIEVTIQSPDVDIPSLPEFNEKEPWLIIFGYKNESAFFRGEAYVVDMVPTFDRDGVKILITLQDKAASLKKITSNASYGSSTLPGVAYRMGKEQGMEVVVENPGHGTSDGTHYVTEGSKPVKKNGNVTAPNKLRPLTFPSQHRYIGPVDDPNSKSQGPLKPWDDPKYRTDNKPPQDRDFQFTILKPENPDDFVRESARKEYDDIERRRFKAELRYGSMGVSDWFGITTPADNYHSEDEDNKAELRDIFTAPPKNPWSPNPPDFKSIAYQRFAIKINPQLRRALEEGKLAPDKVDEYLLALWKFKKMGGLAQGNRTHAQMLNHMASRQTGGYKVVGHGNKLIIRKRNFNQKPVAEYNYQASKNSPVEFVPVTKNKSQGDKATSVSYTGWNKKKKQQYSGILSSENAPDKKEVKTGGGVRPKFVPGSSTDMPSYYRFGAKGSPLTFKAPFTNYFPGGTSQASPTFPNQPDAPAQGSPVNNQGRHIFSADQDVQDTIESAGNVYQDANEKLNPATLNVPGNPRLRSGKMVTINGVGKRYIGNYYITKVSHELSQDTTWTTTCEMVTNTSGATFKLGDTRHFLKGSDKIINTKVRDNAPYNNTGRTIKYRHD